ncbi:hypothetical protein WMY93_010792 [Mugilogobius chulae]|uniref:Uncharacterized protein n=1 Tax=Mugilogobius chulae TaxID=88201 RepID=A0AAW0P8F5_9GOBI
MSPGPAPPLLRCVSRVHLLHLDLTTMCLQSSPAPPGPDYDVLPGSPAPPGPDYDVSPEFTCSTWTCLRCVSRVHLLHLDLTTMCLQSSPAPPGPDYDVSPEVHLLHLDLTTMCLQSSPAPPGPDYDVSPEFTRSTWT